MQIKMAKWEQECRDIIEEDYKKLEKVTDERM
jgi:hypothetical protein